MTKIKRIKLNSIIKDFMFNNARVKNVLENCIHPWLKKKHFDAALNGHFVCPGEENDEEPDLWQETFGGHTDSKPNGPTAVAMDFTFPGRWLCFQWEHGIHTGPVQCLFIKKS